MSVTYTVPAGAAEGSATISATTSGGRAGSTINATDTLRVVVDKTAPTVKSTDPANNATGVAVSSNVLATFADGENIDPATVSGSTVADPGTFKLEGPDTNADADTNPDLIPAAVSFDSLSQTAKLDPSADLAQNTTYTATLKSGASGIKDRAGNALASDYIWSFRTFNPNTAPATTDPTFNPASPKTDDVLEASTTTSDAENNNVSVAWVWKVTRSGNTCQVQTDASAAAAPGVRTSSLDLSPDADYTTTNCTGTNPGTINPSKGDTVVVEATPNDGTVNGTMHSSSVAIANSAPACAAVSLTTNEEATGIANPSCTDADGDTLTYSIVAQGTKGTASVTSGQLQYVPTTNENGSDSFTYKANDGSADSNTATVSVTINPVNDEPSFTAGGNVTVNEDSGAYSAAWATGISAGPANESSQTVSFNVSNTNSALFSSQPAISSSGTLTYTPAPNAFGTSTVTVAAQDNGGTANNGDDTSAAQEFTITVNPVNDAPSFDLLPANPNQTVLVNAGAQSVDNFAGNFSPGPANESDQLLKYVVTITNTTNTNLFSEQPAIDNTGKLTYKLAQDAIGTATVSVKVQDDGGTVNNGVDLSAAKTFTIDVNYGFSGFLQPINWTAHQVLDTNVSTFKGGSTVPVKFYLTDANGNRVVQPVNAQWNTPQKGSATNQTIDETVYTDPATSGSLYKWDSTAQQYIYNWSTKGVAGGFYYKIGLTLPDGNTHYTYISLR